MTNDDVMTAVDELVCPFCPLNCDDVLVRDDGSAERESAERGCRTASLGFRDAANPSLPRIGDQTASWHDVVQRFRDGITPGVAISVETVGSDLTAAKLLLRMQADGLLHLSTFMTPTERALAGAAVRDGVIRVTLADVKRHADVIWLIGGTGFDVSHLLGRIVRQKSPLPVVIQQDVISADQLAQIAAAFHAPVEPTVEPTDGLDDELSAQLAKSNYLAVIVAADGFEAGSEDLAATMLGRLIRQRNQNRRAALLTLDAHATLNSVALWSTNQSITSAVDSAQAPSQTRVRLVSASGQAVASQYPSDPPVMLQLGGLDPGPAQAASYIPTRIPGAHQAGVVIRGDSSVTLPLQARFASDLPAITQVLEAMTS